MREDKISWLVGRGLPEMSPLPPYDEKVCSFLGALSERLIKERAYPDVAAFAFFCRRANILRLKREFGNSEVRLGRGVVFHITPSNIPINFAYSLVFGLLSGCADIVRLPLREWPQVDIVCAAINELLAQDEFSRLADGIAMMRYDRNDEVTGYFSEHCDARVIWGGDDTVRSIRKLPIPPRAVELTFADRYSICALSGDAIERADDSEIARLADNFFNDTYLVDQNACSSPSLVVWLDSNQKSREKFWNAVHNSTKKYELQPIHAIDKYSALAEYLCDGGIKSVTRHENLIYRAFLASLDGLERYRGRFGLFFEYETDNINELAPFVTDKWQTITYYGVDKNILRDFVTQNSLRGIDRIVPVGSALDIGVIWDGHDIVRSLSRIMGVS